MTNVKTITLKEDLNKRLEDYSKKTGKSQSQIIEDSLLNFLKKIAPEKFKEKEVKEGG